MKRSPMNRESAAKAKERQERHDLVEALQRAGLWECQIGTTLGRAMYLTVEELPLGPHSDASVGAGGCQGEPSGLHERRKRSSGGSLTLLANLMPACSPCNLWVEDHPEVAHKLGLVVRPGDHEWFMLGADRGGF